MATFAAALQSATTNHVEVTEGFKGDLRQLGATFLDKGDIFMIPMDFKVFKNKQLTRDEEKPVCFTVAEIFDAQGNSVGGKDVYPGAFNRTVFEWDKDEYGTIFNKHVTHVAKGEPVTEFNSVQSVQDAMKKIAGRKIKVVDITPVKTRDFDDKTKLTTQSVYTFAWA